MGKSVEVIAKDLEAAIAASEGIISQEFPTMKIRLQERPSKKMSAIDKASAFFNIAEWLSTRNIEQAFYTNHIITGAMRGRREDGTWETRPAIIFMNDRNTAFSGELCFFRQGRRGPEYARADRFYYDNDVTFYLTCRSRPEMSNAEQDQLKALLHVDIYKCLKKFTVLGEMLGSGDLTFGNEPPVEDEEFETAAYAPDARFNDNEADARAYSHVAVERDGKFVKRPVPKVNDVPAASSEPATSTNGVDMVSERLSNIAV